MAATSGRLGAARFSDAGQVLVVVHALRVAQEGAQVLEAHEERAAVHLAEVRQPPVRPLLLLVQGAPLAARHRREGDGVAAGRHCAAHSVPHQCSEVEERIARDLDHGAAPASVAAAAAAAGAADAGAGSAAPLS